MHVFRHIVCKVSWRVCLAQRAMESTTVFWRFYSFTIYHAVEPFLTAATRLQFYCCVSSLKRFVLQRKFVLSKPWNWLAIQPYYLRWHIIQWNLQGKFALDVYKTIAHRLSSATLTKGCFSRILCLMKRIYSTDIQMECYNWKWIYRSIQINSFPVVLAVSIGILQNKHNFFS